MNKIIKTCCYNAIVAAVYVVLVFLLSFMSYESIQLRLAEILMFLVIVNKKYSAGLTIGCFIANLIGPFGLIDAIFGSLATLIACLVLGWIKKPWTALIIVPISNILVGIEIAILSSLNFTGAVVATLWVMLGELITMAIGLIVYQILKKKPNIFKTSGDI